jgi:transposase-like protein
MKTHLEEQSSEVASESKPRGNRRNGHFKKTIKGEFGEATLDIPRDRNGEFEPVMIKKGQTRFDGFDGKILSLYGRGMTTRDIQEQLKDMYGVEVSATLISQVTDAVLDEVKA